MGNGQEVSGIKASAGSPVNVEAVDGGACVLPWNRAATWWSVCAHKCLQD